MSVNAIRPCAGSRSGASHLGRRLALGDDPGTKPDIEIVGVAKDTKHSAVRERIRPQVFLDDGYLPARRASGVDPIQALRRE